MTGYHRAPIAEREQFLAEIDRLIGSHVLHGSESLCKLLRYLADHALHHPGVPLKEYQIATEVFGRPADFDPQSDSTIRVQAGRLRMKLAEYYGSDGADDPIIVEMPKGTYVLSFHHRAQGPLHEARLEVIPRLQPRAGWAAIVLSVLLAAALAVIVILIETGGKPDGGAAAYVDPVPAVFRGFWGGFFSGPEEPWVIFSNGAFVGRPETGMRYFDAARDSRNLILDHYTGVGEVLAVHDLDRVFALLHRQIRVKRGSLFSLDDAKNNDLIFVGSPAENLTLRDIPSTQQFVFQRLDSGPRKGDLAIVNLHPEAGEDKYFFGSRSNTPLTEDYSVIALVRGLNPSQWVMILAGTTTLGTQAAVEYVCSETSLKDLLGRLKVSQPGEMKPFEAVLRVKVTRGVPVESSIVALRSGS
ncbi:MAG TPA: helix-turn-helix domain-containing protein [Terriglobales bacterium]|nr:helix-turn-helix domain-containing protein [Terriglobales bacterium]